MSDPVFRRLAVRATLSRDGGEVERARLEGAAGDASWRRWAEEHERGEALVLALRTTLEVDADGVLDTVEVENDHVWVENDIHPPVVAEQVREVVGKDFTALMEKLGDGHIEADEELLGRLLIEVDLGDDVRRELRRRPRAPHHEPRLGPGARPDGPAASPS